jgi:hypothetical protein
MPLGIRSLTPKIGESFMLGQLTILVGPNNCGKSQTLRDIRDFLKKGSADQLLTIQAVDVLLPCLQETLKHVTSRPHASPGHQQIFGVGSDLQSRHEVAPNTAWLENNFDATTGVWHDPKQFFQLFGSYWVAHLDAERRFQLAAPTESYDTRNESPANALQAFFGQGRTAVEELRKAFKAAFGVDVALDWAAMRRLALAIGDEFGEIPDTREGLDNLLKNAPPLASQGDGYRSFAGVVLSTLTFPDRVLLLDEPEAFLHPAQARTLGRWIANAATKRSGQIIVASHSADFLHGIISAHQDTTVVRLNRTGKGSTYHVVPPATTRGLISSPLLSSQPVMDAIFHRGVVVCEGDADRAIYQTIAHSSHFLGQDVGEDLLFIHSNGKDAAATPIELLRKAGAPVCASLDIDVINTPTVFTNVFRALTGADPGEHLVQLRERVAGSVEALDEIERIKLIRDAVSRWIERDQTDLRLARKSLKDIADEGANWDRVKKQGVDFFQGDARRDVGDLINELNKFGFLIVPRGELESWRDFLGQSKGARWNRAALEELGQRRCPADLLTYVRRVVNYFEDQNAPVNTQNDELAPDE